MGRATAAFVLLLVAAGVATATSTWPDCVENAEYTGGFDFVAGYRFTSEGCSQWCKSAGSKCVRWVYYEMGTMCHVKAVEGTRRDNATDLIKDEDMATLGLNDTALAALLADPNTDPAKHLEYAAIEAMRLDELKLITTGDASCVSVHPAPWPDCASLGDAKLNDTSTDNGTEYTATLEQCSYDCTADSQCTFWQYDDRPKRCTRKTGNTTVLPGTNGAIIYIGPKDCYGTVDEAPSRDIRKIDGMWSPWSTLNSPCINLKTGLVADCGGGKMKRHRSCSHPVPRFGGNTCPGYDFDYAACNTHSCQLKDDFLWSEWSESDSPCANGTQTRTSLCGSLRRRLPLLAGMEVGDPSVMWPSCLLPHSNLATALSSSNKASMADCTDACGADAACKYWVFDFATGDCTLHELLNVDVAAVEPNFVGGDRTCTDTEVYAPYCGEFNKNASGEADAGPPAQVSTLQDCAAKCSASADCGAWYLEVGNTTDDFTCYMKTNYSAALTATVAGFPGIRTWYGPKGCAEATEDKPALPEEAEELAYVGTCSLNQLMVEKRVVNLWDKEHCESPCKDNGPCPHNSKCMDLRGELEPEWKCVCQMGMEMVGGRCISPPPTTPTPRPLPELGDDEKTGVRTLLRLGALLLIMFVLVTMLVFACFNRVMNRGRFIHTNEELALLAANICLLFQFHDPEMLVVEGACRNVSICIHFFYTAALALYLMEGIHMYSMVAKATRSGGMISNLGNFVCGWGMAVTVIAFTVSFEYNSYGSVYHCWLPLDSNLIYGAYIPMGLIIILTIMLIESGKNVDDNSMPILNETDLVELASSQWMLKTIFYRLMLTFASFVIGSTAEYEQSVGMFIVFVVVNGVLGAVILVSHCSCDNLIRTKLEKHCCKKKGRSDKDMTKPLIN